MAQITITVADTIAPRIVEALRAYHPAVTAGLADGAAVKAAIIELVKTDVRNYEATKAAGTTDDLNKQIQQISQQRQTTWQNQWTQTDNDVNTNVS